MPHCIWPSQTARELAREACPSMKTKVECLPHHNCWEWKFDGVALILTKFKFIVLPAIIIDVGFLLLVIIIASQCWLTHLQVPAHSIGAGSEVFHTLAANETQVVMAGLQLNYQHSLILSFSAPQTEGQPTLPS